MNIGKGFRKLMAGRFHYPVLAVIFMIVHGLLALFGLAINALFVTGWWLVVWVVVAGILTTVGIWLANRRLRKMYPDLM